MAERPEPVGPVIRPHPRRPDTAERQFLHRHVEDDIVQRHAARDGPVEYAAPLVAIGPEIIQPQRPVAAIDLRDRVVDPVVADDGQDGPEYLLLHQRHVVGRAAHDVERHLACVRPREILVRRVHRLDRRPLRARIVQPVVQPLEMPVVHHRGIVRVRQQGRIHRACRRLQSVDHRLLLRRRGQDVIGREANLPGVQASCPAPPARSPAPGSRPCR